jgi:hypothetical protein
MNHTGTISTSEIWDVSAGDHHLTGNITIAPNVSLTFAPGTKIYNDAQWTITLNAGTSGFTTFYAVGTPTSPIYWGRGAAGIGSGFTSINTLPNNCVVNVQYAKLEGLALFLNYGAPTNTTVTLKHLCVRDFHAGFLQFADNYSDSFIVSNCYFDKAGSNGSGASGLYLGVANISAGSVTYNDCFFNPCPVLRGTILSGAGHTISFNDCYFQDTSLIVSAATTPNYTYNFNRCVFYNMVLFSNGSAVTNPFTINNSIISKIGFTAQVGSRNSNIISNTDIGNGANDINYAITNNNISGSNTVTLSGCYVTGFRLGNTNYTATSGQTFGAITIADERTTPNFPFSPTSIVVSSITTSSVIISWTGLFRTRNRLRYGTTSGYYPMNAEFYGTWENWDGKGQLATSPSFTLYNLQSGTTYYYVCETYDLIYNIWNASVEQTFTTINIQPSYSFIN